MKHNRWFVRSLLAAVGTVLFAAGYVAGDYRGRNAVQCTTVRHPVPVESPQLLLKKQKIIEDIEYGFMAGVDVWPHRVRNSLADFWNAEKTPDDLRKQTIDSMSEKEFRIFSSGITEILMRYGQR